MITPSPWVGSSAYSLSFGVDFADRRCIMALRKEFCTRKVLLYSGAYQNWVYLPRVEGILGVALLYCEVMLVIKIKRI